VILELDKNKNTLLIVFWVVFPIYLIAKVLLNNVPDLFLNFLISISIVTHVLIYIIRSLISYRFDKDFYKRPFWLATVYFAGSVTIYFIFFEIVEIMPRGIKVNFYISLIVFFLFLLKSRIRING